MNLVGITFTLKHNINWLRLQPFFLYKILLPLVGLIWWIFYIFNLLLLSWHFVVKKGVKNYLEDSRDQKLRRWREFGWGEFYSGKWEWEEKKSYFGIDCFWRVFPALTRKADLAAVSFSSTLLPGASILARLTGLQWMQQPQLEPRISL